MQKNTAVKVLSSILLIIGIFGIAFTVYQSQMSKRSGTKEILSSSVSSKKSDISEETNGLPNVKTSDWQLVLVNRENKHDEMNPTLTQVDNISVDSRIASHVKDFLAAARSIDPSEHLISGYRSVAYQKELFEQYVQTEMSNDVSLTREQAEELVKTYSQPAGASEHQTGLAIDMSTVDSLNDSNQDVVKQLQELAPNYGFILRFESNKHHFTGVGYEDWHFRYVGKASAKYMTEHQLSLEEYIMLLKENGK